MLKEERQDYIISRLRSNPSVRLTELSEALKVSEFTVRRDLEFLSDQGLLTKVRGGAIPHSSSSHMFKERIRVAEKERLEIARKALRFVMPGSTILLDGGTTTYALASLLEIPVTVITNNIPIAGLLAGRKNLDVIVTGGRILPNSLIAAGTYAIKLLEQFHVDVCFLGICSLHHTIGVSSVDYFECEMKRAMIACSDKIVALTTHDKIGTAEPFKICAIDKIDTVVSDIDPANEIFQPYRELNIEIV